MLAWMGNVLILTSIWRLGNKHRDAWLLSVVGNMLWAGYGLQEQIWSVVFIDGVMIVVAIHNWRKWR